MNGNRNGGISLNGGDLNMSECIFEGTYSEKEGFESVKHSVICSNEGSITMNGYNGDSIKKNTSLWIVIGDCRFETSEEKPDSRLYVPILKEVRYDGNKYLTFSGEMLIRCNLSYQIFYSDGTPFIMGAVSLGDASNENEREISTRLLAALTPNASYTAHLIYGVNILTQEKRILWPGEEYEEEEVSEESEESDESREGEGSEEGGVEGGGGEGRVVKRGGKDGVSGG